MRLKDFESRRVDELAPATLASYKKKAGAAATAADAVGDRKTADKRFSGIVKATKKQFNQDAKGVSEDNLQGGGPDDEVKFFIDSEPAYYAVMDRFGDHIDFRGDDMVAPLRLWGSIQQTAGDAGGAADIAGLEDEPMWVGDELDEQGVAEGYTDDDIETTKQFRNAIAGLKAKSAIDKAKDGAGAKYYSDGAKVTPQETARRAAERKAEKDKKGMAEGEGNKYGSQENWDSLRKDIRSQYPYKKGTTVTVPHKGKLVNGKIVRYDAGGGGYSPAYVVDIGEYESIMVPPNKVRQGVAEGSDRIAANKQDRLQALENKLKAKGYVKTKDSDGGEYQYRWTRDGAPSYVVNYRSGANGYAEFRKEQGVAEDDDAVAAFLARGGEIQQLKPQSGPKRSGVAFASKHIGSASGRGNTKGKVSGLGANTGKASKPVVTAEQHMAEDALAGMKRLAGIAPAQTQTTPGQRQYRHMPIAVQPR